MAANKRLKLIVGGVTYYVQNTFINTYNVNLKGLDSGNITTLTTNVDDAAEFTDDQVTTALIANPNFVAENYVAPAPTGNMCNYPMRFILPGGGGVVAQNIGASAQYLNPLAELRAKIINLVVTGGIGSAVDLGISFGGAPYDVDILLQAPGSTTFSGTIAMRASSSGPPSTFTAQIELVDSLGVVARLIEIEGVSA